MFLEKKTKKELILLIADYEDRFNKLEKQDQVLFDTEMKNRAILDALPDLMFRIKKDGTFIDYSGDSASLYLMPDLFIGQKITDVLPEPMASITEKKIRKTLKDGKINIYEYSLDIKGETKYYESRMVKYQQDEVLAIIRDTTAIKEAELELKKHRDTLEEIIEKRTAELTDAVKLLQQEVIDRKWAEKKLLIYQEKLRSLTSQTQITEDTQKRRLALELDERVGQSLAMAVMKLSALEEGSIANNTPDEIKEINKIVSQVISATRDLTFEISPPILYDLDFISAVKWLADQIMKNNNINITIASNTPPLNLDDGSKGLVFQVVRELLLNVIKHAKAHNVDININKNDSAIKVDIQDDGKGFDTSRLNSRKGNNFGIFSIKEHLNHIGGFLEIKSEINSGTKASIIFPFSRSNTLNRSFSLFS